MSIVDDYFHQPNEATRQALLETCWFWADSAADSLSSTTSRPRRPGSLHSLRCSRIVEAVEADLQDRFHRIVEVRGAGRQRPSASQIYTQLTDGFFPGSRDEVERYWGFRDFVTALACYHALQQAESNQERKRPAKILAIALSTPIDGTATVPVLPLKVVGKELAKRWAASPPNEFRQAIGMAIGRGRWRILDVLRAERLAREASKRKLAESDAERTSFRDKQVHVLQELLEACYPSFCEMAAQFPNQKGERLFIWLLLGGISHRMKDAIRGATLNHLVQPQLIRTLVNRHRTKNFIRDVYQREVDRLWKNQATPWWQSARDRLLDVLRRDGYEAKHLRKVSEFLGPEPDPELDAMISVQITAKKRKPENGSGDRVTAKKQKVETATSLVWQILLRIGDQTFYQVQAQHLAIDKPLRELRQAKDPYGTIRSWLNYDGKGPAPPRDQVAAVTRFLCEQVGWSTALEALQEGSKA